MNPRRQIFILQGVIIVFLVILSILIYNQSHETSVMGNHIQDLELKCPKCPDVTVSPSFPIHIKGNIPEGHPTEVKCPEVKCPTVQDIVHGIFPGRNTGITSEGKYFDVKSSGSYDLLQGDHSFYKSEEAFPSTSILDPPLRWNNPDVPLNDINNSVDNYLADTNSDESARKHRMGHDYHEKHAHENANKMQRGDGIFSQNTSPKMGSTPPPATQ